MKNLLLVLLASVLILSSLSSCSKGEVVYQCPMKCEGEKTYDKAGKCPVCEMDLAEIQKSEIKKEEGEEPADSTQPHEHDSGDSTHNHTH